MDSFTCKRSRPINRRPPHNLPLAMLYGPRTPSQVTQGDWRCATKARGRSLSCRSQTQAGDLSRCMVIDGGRRAGPYDGGSRPATVAGCIPTRPASLNSRFPRRCLRHLSTAMASAFARRRRPPERRNRYSYRQCKSQRRKPVMPRQAFPLGHCTKATVVSYTNVGGKSVLRWAERPHGSIAAVDFHDLVVKSRIRIVGAHWPTKLLMCCLPINCRPSDRPIEPTAAHKNVSDGKRAVYLRSCALPFLRYGHIE